MNAVKYVEVNAQNFLSIIIDIISNDGMRKELLEDGNYVFRIYSDAVEIGYPEDKPILAS